MNRREMVKLATAGALAAPLSSQQMFAQQALPPKPAAVPSEVPLKGSLPPRAVSTQEHAPHRRSSGHAVARYPVIDIHTHLTFEAGLDKPGKLLFAATPEECLQVMDRKNIRTMVNLTSGYGDNLKEGIAAFQTAHPGRFLCFTEPAYRDANKRNYAQRQGEMIHEAHAAGCRGLKVLKTLGLYLRENITTGPLVKIDDPRFDPMWEACGDLGMPVAIHISDPEAFFLPIDRFNERWEELHAHPSWSFYGKDFPSNRELQGSPPPESCGAILRQPSSASTWRTPKICPTSPSVWRSIPTCTSNSPHASANWAASRVASKKFIDQYQDRTIFGTDAIPKGYDVPQQIFNDDLYQIYYRFLETEDEYFDYAPAPTPPQGRWRIYGMGLSDPVLKKLYWSNAARLLNLNLDPTSPGLTN